MIGSVVPVAYLDSAAPAEGAGSISPWIDYIHVVRMPKTTMMEQGRLERTEVASELDAANLGRRCVRVLLAVLASVFAAW